jgi:hypothetical protein
MITKRHDDSRTRELPRPAPKRALYLQHVLADVVTSEGTSHRKQKSGYDLLRARSNVLRAAVGELIHQIHREHPE